MPDSLSIKKIIHVDMDAFYASVEQLDHPQYRGKPLAVGGGEPRGVVSAASYEARKYGVRSAMSGFLARKKCPDLLFVRPRFDRYKEVSKKIRAVFYEFTDLVEPLSLDEAYLDVTQNKKGNPSATLLALEIRKRIRAETGLNASAGVSINKFLAKVASDINKPNGQKTIAPEAVLPFLENLEIKNFYGVGKVTAEKMYKLGIFNGKDLKSHSAEFLTKHFGKMGFYYHQVVRGIHLSEVRPKRIPKSVGAERTFDRNLSSEIFMSERLDQIASELARRLERNKLSGKTITLKIKYSDFSQQTRSKTLSYYFSDKEVISEHAISLLLQEKMRDSVRLLGIALSNLNTPNKKAVAVQLKLDF